MKLNLPLKDIKDSISRRIIELVQNDRNSQPFLLGDWRFCVITIDAATTDYKFSHNLGFKPTDVIQTSITGAGAATWSYSSFTDAHVYITTTGACEIRAFIGRYTGDQ